MPDRIVVAVSKDRRLRARVAQLSDAVGEALNRHLPATLPAVALGRALVATSLFTVPPTWKDSERVSIQWSGRGPVGTIMTELRKPGHLRGFVSDPRATLARPFQGWRGIGHGLLPGGFVSVLVQEESGRFRRSQVELANGEVDEDLERYFEVSEQTPTRLRAAVSLDGQGLPLAAAGILVQVLPGADAELLPDRRLHERFAANDPEEKLLEVAFDGGAYDLIATMEPAYRCPCDRERVAAGIGLLEPGELLEMINEDQGASVRCEFCAEHFAFSREDLEDILAQKLGRAGA